MNLFECLYNSNEAYCDAGGGGAQWIFTILSGVLQGCPFSGSFFVIAMDPLLFQFRKFLCTPVLATVRACADDVGACIKSLRDLAVFWRIFEAFRRASLPTFKPKKCIIVPPTVECSAANIAAIRTWLSEVLPDCTHFEILPTAKYLGI
jgi:hypothetical protein